MFSIAAFGRGDPVTGTPVKYGPDNTAVEGHAYVDEETGEFYHQFSVDITSPSNFAPGQGSPLVPSLLLVVEQTPLGVDTSTAEDYVTVEADPGFSFNTPNETHSITITVSVPAEEAVENFGQYFYRIYSRGWPGESSTPGGNDGSVANPGTFINMSVPNPASAPDPEVAISVQNLYTYTVGGPPCRCFRWCSAPAPMRSRSRHFRSAMSPPIPTMRIPSVCRPSTCRWLPRRWIPVR